MFCNIPEGIIQSFYRGQVNVTYKDSISQPSSSFRFTAELLKVLNESNFSAEVAPHIFMVTDGGPEHCVNFNSVKIPLLIIFRELHLVISGNTDSPWTKLYQYGRVSYAHFQYWFPECCIREKRTTVR